MDDTREELEQDLRREFADKNPAYSGYDLEGIGARAVEAIEMPPDLGVSLPLDLQATPFLSSISSVQNNRQYESKDRSA
jgi:hypothetical protein